MNLSKMKKNDLVDELKKRGLPSEGLKDDLKYRLMTAIENEEASVDESDPEVNDREEDREEGCIDSDDAESINDAEKLSPEPTGVLTVEDTLKMKEASHPNETFSMIVNVTEEDYNDSIEVNKTSTKNINQTDVTDQEDDNNSTSFRPKSDVDNGDHEVIEVNEEVSIDDNDDYQNQLETDKIDFQDENDVNKSNEDVTVAENKTQDEVSKETKEDSDSEMSLSKESNLMVVQNIPKDTNAMDLKSFFSEHAKIKSAKIVKKNNESDNILYGIVVLESEEDILSIIQKLNQTQFQDHTLTLMEYNKIEHGEEKPVKAQSPISSNDSWGGNKNFSISKNKSKSPQVTPKKSNNVWGDSDDENEICKPKEYSPRKSVSPANNDFPRRDFNRQRRDFRGRGGGRRGGFQGDRGRGGFRNDRYNDYDSKPKTYGGSRDYDKPRYDERDRRGGGGGGYNSGRNDERDNFNSYRNRNYDNRRGRDDHGYRGGRDDHGYRSGRDDQGYRGGRDDHRIGRDDHRGGGSRNDYNDRHRPKTYEQDRSIGRNDRFDDYERRDRGFRKENLYEKQRVDERDHLKTFKRDYPMKRTRNDDDFYPAKKRRDDFSPDRRDRYRGSPKKSFDHGRDYRKPDYRPRDMDGYNRPPKSDYSRKNDEYPNRYSPSRRTSSRPRERDFQPNADFGGRSRRYE